MPKIKPTQFEERQRITRACIACNQERYDISNASLAKYLGFSLQTLAKRKANPGTFTIEELQHVAKFLKFTPVQAASIALGRDLTAKEIKDFILL